jgi:transcriptional regulator with XRE-family HTH domain
MTPTRIFKELQIKPTQSLMRPLRRMAGLKLREVSKRSGYNCSSISQYERSTQEPTLFTYRAIINSYGFEVWVGEAPVDERLFRDYRTASGFSQDQMAQMLGCAPATVWRFEMGYHPIKFTRAMDWLSICNKPASIVIL